MVAIPHFKTGGLLLAALVCFSTFLTPVSAATPEFVGVLAYALDSDATEKLNIDAETQQKLKQLIADREDKALELALSIQDLTKAEQAEKLAPFVAESEKLGFALLTADQQQGLKQFGVKQAGMKSLLTTEMADSLKLTADQQTQIGQLAAKIDAAQAAGAPAVEAARKEFERESRKLLSPTQQAAWDQMAGLVGEPADPLPAVTPPAEATPAEMKPAVAAAPVDANVPSPSDKAAAPKPEVGPNGEPLLRFSFRYAPWRDVLDWFAEQSDLSMVMDAPPSGTFNYTDGRAYTPAQAIDLLNSVLLTKGYTLVRRDKMLLVVNLEDGIPPDFVTTVPAEKLDERGEYELVKTLFTLSRMTAEEAEAEISKLIGPQGQVVVLPKSKQIFVTETAGRLRTIRDVINAVERPLSEKVHIVTLENVGPEEALTVVRQLLDLPPEANGTDDGTLRIAVDALGGRLFVSGEPELTSRVQEILKMVDEPGGMVAISEQPQLEVYAVGSSQPQTALQVMQTLLAGLPEVRLAIDENTGNLVALAKPSQHATIRATLEQMQRDSKKISVIQLQTVDPQLAVLSISKLFGGGGETPNPSAPIVDADPISGMLLVRGTQDQIAQINDLLKQMGEDPEAALASSLDRGRVRTLSLPGASSSQILDELEMIWPTVSTARIRVVRPSAPPIRTVAPQDSPVEAEFQENLRLLFPPAKKPTTPREDESANATSTSPFRFVSETTVADAAEDATTEPVQAESAEPKKPATPKPPAEIIIMPGPGGIVIASDDTEALDQLEELIQMLGDRIANSGADYTVFYLKHAPADVAADLLSKIMTGQAASGGGDAGGGLLGDMASSMLGGGGGLMGSLLGLGGSDGGSYTASGSFSVVADGRLNALVVKGSAADVQVIDQLLKIIDQPHSPEDVQTKAKPRMIPVLYQPANDVLNVVKQVYADRIADSGGGGQQRQPSPEDFIRALGGGRGGRGGGGGQGGQGGAPSEPPKMTIGVDTRSNALVVSAPDPLFDEVKLLVEQLDQAGSDSQETMQVVNIRKSNPETVQNALRSILGANVTSNTTSATSSTNGQSTPNQPQAPSQADADAMRQRMEMFNRIRGAMEQGGGGRGGRGGGAPGGGGGGRGGGAPGGGGGRGGR